jgi:hypothetical protein
MAQENKWLNYERAHKNGPVDFLHSECRAELPIRIAILTARSKTCFP